MNAENEWEKYKISLWLLIIVYLFILFCVGAEILFLFFVGDDSFGFLSTIISIAIGFYCADKNARWAFEIDKSVNLAYGIGFFIGVLGLIGYWVYYKSNKRRIRRDKNSNEQHRS